MTQDQALQQFLQVHQLPGNYLSHVERRFSPLANALAEHRKEAQRPLVVGINGSQGSGKSTLASLLALLLNQLYELNVVDLSIDDFYLTRQSRQQLAETEHPLLATRGVPGTHDTKLMRKTLQALVSETGKVSVPRFDKARDDRLPTTQWQRIEAPLDLVIIEGWCLGVEAQDDALLSEPINELEAQADPDGKWRAYVNSQLKRHYPSIHSMVDVWIMLQAPSFDSVYQWRLEQEQKLAEKTGDMDTHIMSPLQLMHFIQHYQRLTEHALKTLPQQMHFLFKLDTNREIIEATTPNSVHLS